MTDRFIHIGDHALGISGVKRSVNDWTWREEDPTEYRIPMPLISVNREAAHASLLDRDFRATMRKMMDRYVASKEQKVAYEVLGEALAIIDQLQAELDALKNADHPAGLAPSIADKET